MSDKKYHYRIKDWVFDPDVAELSNSHQKKRLQNRVAQVLIVLLEANGELVTKPGLLHMAWKDIVVSENSLDKSISELRKILGDSKTDPKYIETLPKKGYRFIAPVQRIQVAANPIPTVTSRRSIWVWVPLFTILGLTAIFLWIGISIPPKKVLSPNGNTIASIQKDGEHYALLVEDLSEETVRKLDSFALPETQVIGWSKDNSKIVYNTTQSKNDFYALNVYNLFTDKKEYIKFPKKDRSEQLKSIIGNAPTSLLEHRLIKQNDNTVHYIIYAQKDTIKVLFNNKKISDLKW
ncbi:winged helix-turn-helix domain-containing protein [Flagellimonas flava]|uniref:winged helix-turn-helix domain-containing protein n=1 Tax=Flagellimonas flava TaxID=570519 RepID=UPI003D65A1EE